MIPLSVPEISPCDAFCDMQHEEKLGILVHSWINCEQSVPGTFT